MARETPARGGTALEPTADGYHEGEIQVQERAGVRVEAGRIGRSIHAAIPPVAREFISSRRWLVASHRDPEGQPWAWVWSGPQGFATAPDERTLRIRLDETTQGPRLAPGDALGLLAMDLDGRRRMRVNGRVEARGEGVLTVAVDQTYANCPKYIQARSVLDEAPAPGVASPSTTHDELTDIHRRWIEGSDTFFIATAHFVLGADASHRGGMPGFVRVEGPRRIAWPDYRGNTMFNTLGNLAIEPRAGLVWIDFEKGHLLQVAGRAEIDWDSPRVSEMTGAERAVTLEVTRVVERPGGFPLRMALREYSPHNPR